MNIKHTDSVIWMALKKLLTSASRIVSCCVKIPCYWLTRPLVKTLIYPGSSKVMMGSAERYCIKGRKVWEALGAQRLTIKVKDKDVDAIFIDASTYVRQWPAVQRQYEETLYALGMAPMAPTMSMALGMPQPTEHYNQDNAVAILFLGNAMLYEFSFAEAAIYLDRGISVALFNYPGFGRSQGSPSAPTTCQAGEAIYREVRRLRGAEAKVILHGISIGGGIAAYLMHLYSATEPLYLVLDRSFASMGWVAQELFPLLGMRFLIRRTIDWLYPYLVEEWVAGLDDRVAIIRAQHDMIMASYHAEKIASRAFEGREDRQGVIIDVSGGHNHGDGGEVCWLYDTESQDKLEQQLHKWLTVT